MPLSLHRDRPTNSFGSQSQFAPSPARGGFSFVREPVSAVEKRVTIRVTNGTARRALGWTSFEIVAPLGASAMGEIYRANDKVLKRDVWPYAGFGQFAARNLPPARSTVQAAGLPKDALVEIELVAAL